MAKEFHIEAPDLLGLVQVEPGSLGKYAVVPGPITRVEPVVNKLKDPVKDFTFQGIEMFTGELGDTLVTTANSGLYEDHVMLLDERQLPDSEEYVRINDYNDAAAAIRTMKTRAFGQLLTALYAMILTAQKAQDLIGELKEAAAVLEKSRPTFGFRKYTQLAVSRAEEAVSAGNENAAETVISSINGLLGTIRDMRIKRGRITADLLEDGDTVLTHCNTSGELLLAARECRSQGKRLTFYATETRPYFQGRLTAWEMAGEGFHVTVIPDNRAASIIGDGLCTKVITGSDRVARNGDIVNKTGTYQLALCAHEAGVPFYAFVQDPGTAETGMK